MKIQNILILRDYASLPSLDQDKDRLYTIPGVVPNPMELPEGCYFAPRCEYARPECRKHMPGITKVNEGHEVRCFLYSDKIEEYHRDKEDGEVSDKVLIQVRNLTKHFPVKKTRLFEPRSYVRAVNGVSFDIYEGETLGLVGESGSGKSTLGRTMIKLYPATAGEVIYKGKNILELSEKQMKPLRKELQIIFQDPYSSLNPRLNVFSIIGEAMLEHKIAKKGKDLEDKVKEIIGDMRFVCISYV